MGSNLEVAKYVRPFPPMRKPDAKLPKLARTVVEIVEGAQLATVQTALAHGWDITDVTDDNDGFVIHLKGATKDCKATIASDGKLVRAKIKGRGETY